MDRNTDDGITFITSVAGAAVIDRNGHPHTLASASTIAVAPGMRGPLLAAISPDPAH